MSHIKQNYKIGYKDNLSLETANTVNRLLWISFCCLAIVRWVSQCTEWLGLSGLSEETSGIFVILGMLTLCLATWQLYKNRFEKKNFPRSGRIFLYLLLVWGSITIARSFTLNYYDLRLLVAGRILGWNWLVPVAFILGASLSSWQTVLPVMVIHAGLGILAGIFLYLSSGLASTFGLTYAAPLLLIFYYKLPKTAKIFAILGTLFNIYVSIKSDSRTSLVAILAFILSALVIHMLRSHRYKIRTRIVIIVIIPFILLSGYYFCGYYEISSSGNMDTYQLSEYQNHLIDTGSRTHLVDGFFETSNTKELVFGRGALGRYFWDTRRWVDGRDAIENGWLFVVLKGGFIMVGLFCMLVIPATVLGIFYSKNWFARGCGFIVLERIFEMIPYGLPAADLTYIIFWMAAGVCWNKNIRDIPEKEFGKINICPLRKIRFKS